MYAYKSEVDFYKNYTDTESCAFRCQQQHNSDLLNMQSSR